MTSGIEMQGQVAAGSVSHGAAVAKPRGGRGSVRRPSAPEALIATGLHSPRPRPRPSPTWPARYATRLYFTDLAVIASVLVVFGITALASPSEPVAWEDGPAFPYWLALVAVGVLWMVVLDAFDTRDRHIVGSGPIEYRRIINGSLTAFAICVTFAFFTRLELSRGLLLLAIPAGMVLLLLSRWIWRQWLRSRQRHNDYVHRTIVVGEPTKVTHVVNSIRRSTGAGLEIVGVVTSKPIGGLLLNAPVLGDYATIETVIADSDIDTIVIVGSDDLDPQTMRRIGWAASDHDKDLVVAPALTDIAGPRLHTRPVAGLPLIYVEFPTLSGPKRFGKRAFDIIGSAGLILLSSPIMLITAIAVAIDSRGPLFYRQTRIGRRGRAFGMIKFRSMIQNADDQLATLLDLQGTTDQPLFKVNADPRITRVGRFIRKHSIDELPQLFNVFAGQMSLVGPRPQRDAEVALYDDAAYRRLLVKPGMSGLWQVSGRSTLSWEDSLRLDLYYVENWSMTQDIQILLRTVKAVVAPGDGAH